jgi:hypothetical protein
MRRRDGVPKARRNTKGASVLNFKDALSFFNAFHNTLYSTLSTDPSMSSAADKNAHDETPKTKASAKPSENGEQVADALFSPYEHFSGITLKNRYSTK